MFLLLTLQSFLLGLYYKPNYVVDFFASLKLMPKNETIVLLITICILYVFRSMMNYVKVVQLLQLCIKIQLLFIIEKCNSTTDIEMTAINIYFFHFKSERRYCINWWQILKLFQRICNETSISSMGFFNRPQLRQSKTFT